MIKSYRVLLKAAILHDIANPEKATDNTGKNQNNIPNFHTVFHLNNGTYVFEINPWDSTNSKQPIKCVSAIAETTPATPVASLREQPPYTLFRATTIPK